MLTSDDEVIPGMRYRIVLHCSISGESLTYDLSSETYALLIFTSKEMERRRGKWLEFVEFFVQLHHSVLPQQPGTQHARGR